MNPPQSATPTVPSMQGAGCALLLVRLSRISRHRLRGAFASLDMRTHEFAVLHYLDEAGPLSQGALGRALRLDPSNLVALLDGLESASLLNRRRDPTDRRRHLVELTAAGRRRLQQAEHAALETENEMLEPLSPRERAHLHEMLARMASHACGGSEKGRCC